MISFVNNGHLDLKAITTFGVSVKEKSNAIGYFGTGLKYALAVLLREGCEVMIRTNGKDYVFGLSKGKVRGQDYNFVRMNRTKLPFTTELGKKWEVWQALREIYSNCKDEDGCVIEGEESTEQWDTVIQIQGEAFESAWKDRHTVFLSTQPLISQPYGGGKVEIHPGPSKHLYYQGIRAYQLEKPSLFAYNFTANLELTEDRTIKSIHLARYRVETVISKHVEDEDVIDAVLFAKPENWESALCFQSDEFGKFFLSRVKQAIADMKFDLNRTALDRYRELVKPALDLASTGEPTKADQQMIDTAAEICRRAGFNVQEYPIRVAEYLGKNIMGRAHEGTIYITRVAFMEGVPVVAATLLEEYIHLRYRLYDETRELESFLFNTIIYNTIRGSNVSDGMDTDNERNAKL